MAKAVRKKTDKNPVAKTEKPKLAKTTIYKTVRQPSAKEKITTVREVIGSVSTAQLKKEYSSRIEEMLKQKLYDRDKTKSKIEKRKINKQITLLRMQLRHL